MQLKNDIEHFDMLKKPERIKWYLRPITWIISYPAFLRHRTKINKIRMDGLKPPYLLLCNHNAFLDFKIATMAMFPHRANYVVAIDGFIGRELIMRKAGCICKRKFTNDIRLVKQLQRVVRNGDVAVIYPEARYSLCGTTAVLPDSLGKLAKILKVPVVTLITHGHHINSPFWNLHNRGIKTEADMTQIIDFEEISILSVSEINDRIDCFFCYDDFAWQRENKILVKYKHRARGIHKVLYQCPRCKTEYRMNSDRSELWCEACGKRWTMNEFGELEALSGTTEFSHVPDWYEWERACVRREVVSGSYFFEADVIVKTLPNSDGFIDLGNATLEHTLDGFCLQGAYCGNAYEIKIPAQSIYSCHIEYEYLGKFGDCIDLNTLGDTYYIYPKCDFFSVTKIALATEEIYQYWKNVQLQEIKKSKV
ncbi:MAG: 1-acyl-sn-glycerol-3-phosphate acyltransferase [Anaerofustis sp.]